MKPIITVIGSINIDLVTVTSRWPKPGETIKGKEFSTIPGGKGANQAVAAARLGADVTMIGCVGDDLFGERAIENLKIQGVNTENVEPVTHVSTGTATITLSEGDNTIIIVPGANDHMTPEVIKAKESIIAVSDMILLQLEIPLDAVIAAVKLAKKHHVPVLLNPAPIQPLPQELLDDVDYLTPNEHEFAEIKANGLIKVKRMIVTKGEAGADYSDANTVAHLPGYSIDVVDTTGAGDTFNAALAIRLAQGKSVREAIQFANAAGALSVTKLGAQSGMPTLEELEDFLGRMN